MTREGCGNCQRLRAELETAQPKIEELAGKIQELEVQLRRGRRQAAPFPRDQSKSKRVAVMRWWWRSWGGSLSGWLKQKCCAHLLHELAQQEQDKTRGAVRFPRALLSVLREALQLKADRPKLEEAEFRSRYQALGSELDALISPRRQFSDPDNARMAKRLRKQRAHGSPKRVRMHCSDG